MKLPNFNKARVCVLGDVMLDRYWHGDTDRISPEAPVPVVKISKIEDRIGGAGNVAANSQSLGASVTLVSCVGEDDAAHRIKQLCCDHAITPLLIPIPQYPTVTKLRVLGRAQQLIRLDFERVFNDSTEILYQALESIIADCDVLILSDYAKGVLTDPQPFIQCARAHNKPVIVDPKQNDWTLYQGATVLTPNLKEFQQAIGKKCTQDAEIEQEARFWLEKADLQALLVTRGAGGMSLISRQGPAIHIPALVAKEVYDVTGAGDTVTAAFGTLLATGADFYTAAYWANKAAGIVVGKVGTATVTPEELTEEQQPHRTANKVVSEKSLMQTLHTIRQQGKRIVMTNGCFDILHPGHIQYLDQAKALGDVLIMAVNDDASVSRLKGPLRPVHNLSHRMHVLAGLAAIDWVVPFAEDTPQRLIATVLPDVLCKGGDYKVADVAGSAEVLAHGGEVKILPFLDGCSTTQTIEKILKEI